MQLTVDEPQYSTPIQKPSQSNQESNSENTVYVTRNSTSPCNFDQTTSTFGVFHLGLLHLLMPVPLSKIYLHHLILHVLQSISACHQHNTPQEQPKICLLMQTLCLIHEAREQETPSNKINWKSHYWYKTYNKN